jgi:hypothetical protein
MVFFLKPNGPKALAIDLVQGVLNARSPRLVHSYVQYNFSHFSPCPFASASFSEPLSI